jgi:hypothetical protein
MTTFNNDSQRKASPDQTRGNPSQHQANQLAKIQRPLAVNFNR